jgi:hypothetical protein
MRQADDADRHVLALPGIARFSNHQIPAMNTSISSRTMLRSTVAAAALLLSTGAHALTYYNVHPTDIRSSANFLGFRTTEAIQNPASCGDSDFYAIPAAYDSKAAMAILLTANVSGRTVTILVSASLCATNGRPVVTDVILEG